MYKAISISRSLKKRDALIYSTDGGTTFTEIPKKGIKFYGISSSVNNAIPNSVNKNLDNRNLMIVKGVDEETTYLKFDYLKSSIGGSTATSLGQALTYMETLTGEVAVIATENKTAGSYTLSHDYCISMTIIVNSGTISIEGGSALAAGTYTIDATPDGYVGATDITITGTADIIYQYLS